MSRISVRSWRRHSTECILQSSTHAVNRFSETLYVCSWTYEQPRISHTKTVKRFNSENMHIDGRIQYRCLSGCVSYVLARKHHRTLRFRCSSKMMSSSYFSSYIYHVTFFLTLFSFFFIRTILFSCVSVFPIVCCHTTYKHQQYLLSIARLWNVLHTYISNTHRAITPSDTRHFSAFARGRISTIIIIRVLKTRRHTTCRLLLAHIHCYAWEFLVARNLLWNSFPCTIVCCTIVFFGQSLFTKQMHLSTFQLPKEHRLDIFTFLIFWPFYVNLKFILFWFLFLTFFHFLFFVFYVFIIFADFFIFNDFE